VTHADPGVLGHARSPVDGMSLALIRPMPRSEDYASDRLAAAG
jgi:hypothetical protein